MPTSGRVPCDARADWGLETETLINYSCGQHLTSMLSTFGDGFVYAVPENTRWCGANRTYMINPDQE